MNKSHHLKRNDFYSGLGRQNQRNRSGILVVGESVSIVSTTGTYDNTTGDFIQEGTSLGYQGGVHMLVDMLGAMRDFTRTILLPVKRSDPIQLYRDHRKGQVCSSSHPPAIYDGTAVERALEKACESCLPPEAVIIVDTGSKALTDDRLQILIPFLDAWEAPVFLLTLGEGSLIANSYGYTAVVRQAYCGYSRTVCTCMCNHLYIRDLEIGGFCDTRTFTIPTTAYSKAPTLGLGEMAISYIVSEYTRDNAMRKDLGKSLAFLKYAFSLLPADQLVTEFGRDMLKTYEETHK